MKTIPNRVRSHSKKNRGNFLIAAALCSMFFMPAAYAQPLQEEPVRNQLLLDNETQETATRISRREASEIARETFQGRVLSMRLEEGRQWRIRMDQEGNVFNVLVDANSGRVSRPTE